MKCPKAEEFSGAVNCSHIGMYTDDEFSLSDVLALAQISSAGRPVSVRVTQNTASTEQVIFDSTTLFSEVWIVGDTGAELRLSAERSPPRRLSTRRQV